MVCHNTMLHNKILHVRHTFSLLQITVHRYIQTVSLTLPNYSPQVHTTVSLTLANYSPQVHTLFQITVHRYIQTVSLTLANYSPQVHTNCVSHSSKLQSTGTYKLCLSLFQITVHRYIQTVSPIHSRLAQPRRPSILISSCRMLCSCACFLTVCPNGRLNE